jgi:C_GCAxxG_C_C family probable redox protein
MLTVGEYFLGELDAHHIRMTTALAGGVGDTRQELCGALSSGALIIGFLYGRTHPHENDQRCMSLAGNFHQRFLAKFGSTRCQTLRSAMDPSSPKRCSELVEHATRILIEILEGEK